MYFYSLLPLFIAGVFVLVFQRMFDAFARGYVNFFGSDEERKHIAETKSTVAAIGSMMRLMQAAKVRTEVPDPELARIQRETALLNAQALHLQAQRSFQAAGGVIAPADAPSSPTPAATLPTLPDKAPIDDSPAASEGCVDGCVYVAEGPDGALQCRACGAAAISELQHPLQPQLESEAPPADSQEDVSPMPDLGMEGIDTPPPVVPPREVELDLGEPLPTPAEAA